MIQVVLPGHLRTLARIEGEMQVQITGAVTQRSVLDAIEARYPALRGTMRDQSTGARRAFVRFFACAQDLSHESPDAPLPDAVVSGREPFLIIAAIAGGSTCSSRALNRMFTHGGWHLADAPSRHEKGDRPLCPLPLQNAAPTT
jgi:sulfur-carrier protein